MAALTRRQPKAVGTISGNQWAVGVYEVTAGQVLRRGSVVIEASGKASLAAAAFTADTILGVAQHNADPASAWYLGASSQEDSGGTFGGDFMGASDLLGSVAGIGVSVALANADTLFEFCMDEALQLADLGAVVELQLNSGIFSVDRTLNGAENFGTIVAIPNYPGVAIGDTNAPVHVIILASASVLY